MKQSTAAGQSLKAKRSLLIGRTEYTVVCFENDGSLRWNVTYAEYTQNNKPVDLLAGTIVFRSVDGTAITVTNQWDDVVWTQSFTTPVMNVYRTDATGSLRQIPLKSMQVC